MSEVVSCLIDRDAASAKVPLINMHSQHLFQDPLECFDEPQAGNKHFPRQSCWVVQLLHLCQILLVVLGSYLADVLPDSEYVELSTGLLDTSRCLKASIFSCFQSDFPHCGQGVRDKSSAFWCFYLCWILKSIGYLFWQLPEIHLPSQTPMVLVWSIPTKNCLPGHTIPSFLPSSS